MVARRIDAGPLIAVIGAAVLLVSLFLDWFDPGLTAWEVFEVLDLVLAALGILAIVAALGVAGAPIPTVDARMLGWAAGIALIVVLAALLDHPPAARGADPDLGLWLAAAGAALMVVGALLSTARIKISVDVQGRRTRMAAVDARRAAKAEPEPTTRQEPPPESRL